MQGRDGVKPNLWLGKGTRPLPPDWEQIRAAVLARDPICTTPTCGQLSRHADHIIPRAFGGSDDMDNLQGKCRSCHGKKTMRERLGDGFGFVYGTETG
jgi:5-methylcytosine-specific restriction endonuclease McrA